MNHITTKTESLIHTIDHLKKEVQYLIDRLKGNLSSQEQQRLTTEKKEKLKALKNTTAKLKDLVKQEKAAKQKEKETSHASRVIDSLEFQSAKSGKSHEAAQKVRKARVQREEAREQYNNYLKYETEYNKHDPQEFPGYLFLSDTVLTNYGPCPFIKMNIKYTDEDAHLKAQMQADRKQWLESQPDIGKTYYELREQLVDQKQLKQARQELEMVEATLLDHYETILTPSQLELWKTSHEFAQEYVSCSIKTKRIKERFKTMVHSLSVLHAETHIPIHEYISIKYQHAFMVNDISIQNDVENAYLLQIQSNRFSECLEDYKRLYETVEQQTRYVNNTIRNLKHELYLFLTGQKTLQTNVTLLNKKNIVQSGKYFKRWTALTLEEKNERFYSFADFHVERYMVLQGIITREHKPQTVAQLAELLQHAYGTKRMIYRDFRWITKRGVIDAVKILRFDKEKLTFMLAPTAISKKIDQLESKQAENQNAPVTKSKKKASQRTIITKENSEIINEQILLTIIESTKKSPTPTLEDVKDTCIERVRTRLMVNKVSNRDKKEIIKIAEEMFNVVKSNTPM